MTSINKIIKDAIEGEWINISNVRLAAGYIKGDVCDGDGWITKEKIPLAEALLDPAFWQAVGKTRGWEYKLNGGGKMIIDNSNPKERKEIAKEWGIKPDWQVYWYTFIDYLADGLTIEQALNMIE